MLEKKKLLIGEFSQRINVSKRMLRYYDDIGLLVPAYTDQITGYRYYDESQEDIVVKIQILSRLGFSLKEIVELTNGFITAEDFLALVKEKEADLRIRIDKDTGILIRIQQLIKGFNVEKTDKVNLAEHLLQIDWNTTVKRSEPVNYKQTFDLLRTLRGPDLFYEKIEKIVSQMEGAENTLSFITFDIDKFLKVNDEYGFDVGDKVIYSIMETILNQFPLDNEQILASRLGGDEMGLFISKMNDEELIQRVESVLKEVENTDFHAIGCPLPITVSAGIYKCHGVSNFKELRHNSTKALLEAKRRGGNCFFVFSP